MAWGTNEGQNMKIKVLRGRPSREPSKVGREWCHHAAAFQAHVWSGRREGKSIFTL